MKTKSNLRNVAVIIVFALLLFSTETRAQDTVDKTVATVSDGVRTELITYSDLLWQLAMQPGVPLASPSSDDLNLALQLIINQRLFSLEAQRLPNKPPTKAETEAEIKRVMALFPTSSEFIRRLNLVGFNSAEDDNFVRIMEQRVAIDKYLDFRFRAFVVITAEDEEKYYREVFVPYFRSKNPGVLVPKLDEKRPEINQILTEQKVAAEIERFLDEAKRRAEIVVLNEV